LRWRDTNTDGTLEDTLYYCNDANFNVTALVDASDGSVVERVMYDPYGKPTFYDGTWAKTQLDQETPGTLSAYANAVLFTGHRLDDETGLYVTLYRYYHPTLGRWLSRDPIGYLGVVSLYHYLDADPVGVTDSFGLAASSSTDWTKRLPDLRVGETLKLDYSTKGWAEEQMGTEAEAAVKAQFPAADYPNTKIHIGNSIANLVQNENAAGTSGFMVGWSFEVGVVTSPTPDRFGATCHCGFQGTMWKFLAYVVVKDNQNGSYVYIRSSRSDVTGVVSPDRSTGFLYSDTMEHESWHTDGVPDEVRKKASDLGITIDKPGYRGQAKAERGAAMAAFAALVMENRDVTTNEVNTAPTREWCKEKGEAIMERHLTGDDAILRVLNAGLYHTGLTRHRPNYYFAPVPQER
jgi:RHS repeat-associated protein